MRIPRGYGRWVGRDDLIQYLHEYARSYDLQPELGVIVERIDRGKDSAWQVATNAGVRVFSQVVVATGCSHTPRLPDWPRLDSYPGEVIHSADYREPSSYAGRDVLVVGSGNSATEIALDLLGVDAKVKLSVRTPPTILRRDVFGLPIQLLGIALTKAPATVLNPLLTGMRRISIPDLSAQGLPRTQNPYTHFLETGVVPIIDTGIVAAIRSRQIQGCSGSHFV